MTTALRPVPPSADAPPTPAFSPAPAALPAARLMAHAAAWLTLDAARSLSTMARRALLMADGGITAQKARVCQAPPAASVARSRATPHQE